MKYLVTLLLLVTASVSHAAELSADEKYRTRTSLLVAATPSACDSDSYTASLNVGAQSTLVVVSIAEQAYTVKFTSIYQYSVIKPIADRTEKDYKTMMPSDVIEDREYYLCRKDANGLEVESVLEPSYGGVVSGPLIVPFKYRLDDKSIDGSATVGYFAGYGFDFDFFDFKDEYIVVTPFLSVGLTQISFEEIAADGSRTSETKSGVSWAAGFLIRNWADLNLGIVYGQDRVGDSEFTHEGKGWVSVSVGWEI